MKSFFTGVAVWACVFLSASSASADSIQLPGEPKRDAVQIQPSQPAPRDPGTVIVPSGPQGDPGVVIVPRQPDIVVVPEGNVPTVNPEPVTPEGPKPENGVEIVVPPAVTPEPSRPEEEKPKGEPAVQPVPDKPDVIIEPDKPVVVTPEKPKEENPVKPVQDKPDVVIEPEKPAVVVPEKPKEETPVEPRQTETPKPAQPPLVEVQLPMANATVPVTTPSIEDLLAGMAQEKPTPEVPVGREMSIPEKAKDLDFLKGKWRCNTGLFNTRTQEPVIVEFSFDKNGNGTVSTIEKSSGTAYSGKARGKLKNGGLAIACSEQRSRKKRDKYSSMQISCVQEGGHAICRGVNADGTRWDNATFVRIQ